MSEAPICMICQEDTQTSTNPLLSPCSCKGSISSIHRECLEQWIFHSKHSRCNICHGKYRIRLEDIVTQPNKFKLMILSALYGIIGFLFLAAFFFYKHFETYRFANGSLVQTVHLVIATTYSHLAIYLWMGFLSLISILTVLMYIFAFLAMFTGEFQPMQALSHGNHYEADFVSSIDKMLASYPLQTPIVPYFFHGVLCFLATGTIFYGIYKILLLKNPPTIRRRIRL